MNFGAFMQNNPQLMGQAMSMMGGAGQQGGPQTPPPRDAAPGIDPVQQQPDTGEHGNEGLKRVAKTIASFWAGGAGGAMGGAMGGAGGAASSAAKGAGASGGMGNMAGNILGMAMGGGGNAQPAPPAYDRTAQDWMQQYGGGY